MPVLVSFENSCLLTWRRMELRIPDFVGCVTGTELEQFLGSSRFAGKVQYQVEQVKLLDRFSTSNKSLTGTLYLTATHLLFIDSSQRETWILHHHIAAVEKLPLTTSGCPLVIQCKNFRIVHFVVPRERDCHDIYNSLLQLSRTAKYEELYAFSYNPKQNESEQVKGWQLIDLAEEYKRMGVPNANWQLSDANRDYK
ncbi:PREDICTED: myotubularin-related protein 6-like, partial [Phaethon lepturus]|uniref:myotubularin-related protein 6-like n=1 Tax=Phaethon lepturus TaxID=97097 RepID=UPI0005305576